MWLELKRAYGIGARSLAMEHGSSRSVESALLTVDSPSDFR